MGSSESKPDVNNMNIDAVQEEIDQLDKIKNRYELNQAVVGARYNTRRRDDLFSRLAAPGRAWTNTLWIWKKRRYDALIKRREQLKTEQRNKNARAIRALQKAAALRL